MKKKKKNIYNILSDILCYLTFGISFIALVAVFFSRMQGKDPSILGYKLYVVKTNSMEPTLPVGSVLIEHIDKDVKSYDNGTIITFQTVTSQGIITNSHRIVAYYYEYTDLDGNRVRTTDKTGSKTIDEFNYKFAENTYYKDAMLIGYITKGDNASAEDPNPVLFSAIKSRCIRKSAFLSWFYSLFDSFWGLLLIIIIPAFLIIILQIISYIKLKVKSNVSKEKLKTQEIEKIKEKAIEDYLKEKNE